MTWNPGAEPGAPAAPGGGDRVLGRAGAALWLAEPRPRLVWSYARSVDRVIVVGDGYEAFALLERIRGLEELGIELLHYPLRVDDAPTVYSLLGLVAWIEPGALIVEASPAAKLVRAAHSLVADGQLSGLGDLTSPLHARLLWLLDTLRRLGVDLAREADKHRVHAFTGGDAAWSDLLLLMADMSRLVPALRGCLPEIYARRGCTDTARLFMESLDPFGEGAVAAVAGERTGQGHLLYLGCRLLGLGDSCSRETRGLLELSESLGLNPVLSVEPVFPEEAACIAYGDIYSCE